MDSTSSSEGIDGATILVRALKQQVGWNWMKRQVDLDFRLVVEVK